MKIGILGAGNIGGTLVRKLRSSGHEVRVANSRRPESLSGLAAETEATPEGKQLVMRLVDDTGFDAVDAGTIADSWRQQLGTPAYCTELTADQLREALGLADREAAPKRRDAIAQIISTWQGPPNFEEWLRLYRATARFPAADD